MPRRSGRPLAASDEHGPKRPVLLAVEQQLGGATCTGSSAGRRRASGSVDGPPRSTGSDSTVREAIASLGTFKGPPPCIRLSVRDRSASSSTFHLLSGTIWTGTMTRSGIGDGTATTRTTTCSSWCPAPMGGIGRVEIHDNTIDGAAFPFGLINRRHQPLLTKGLRPPQPMTLRSSGDEVGSRCVRWPNRAVRLGGEQPRRLQHLPRWPIQTASVSYTHLTLPTILRV